MEKSFFYSDALQSRIPTSPPTKLPDQSLQVLAVHNTNQRPSETGAPASHSTAPTASRSSLCCKSTLNLHSQSSNYCPGNLAMHKHLLPSNENKSSGKHRLPGMLGQCSTRIPGVYHACKRLRLLPSAQETAGDYLTRRKTQYRCSHLE